MGKKWAEVPLRLIMDSVIRVTFPAFSRLQHSKEHLGKAIEKTLFGLSIAMMPISAGLLYFVEPALQLIPKYGKWEPALISFYIFVITALLAGFSTPLTNALNAVGKIKITMFLMIFWTTGTWVFTLLFIPLFGFNGFAIALFILSLALFAVIRLSKGIAAFSFIEQVKWPFVAMMVQILWYQLARGSYPYNAVQLMAVALGGVILYVGVLWYFERKRIVEIIAMARK